MAAPSLVVLTAILGGVIGTVAAGTIEYDALHRLGALPMLLVGLIEESAKLIVPLGLLVFLRRPDPRAGVIVGVASGMGWVAVAFVAAVVLRGAWDGFNSLIVHVVVGVLSLSTLLIMIHRFSPRATSDAGGSAAPATPRAAQPSNRKDY